MSTSGPATSCPEAETCAKLVMAHPQPAGNIGGAGPTVSDASDSALPELAALDGCRIWRSAGPDRIEVVSAAAARRRFGPQVATTLGICLKRGPAHRVTANGRRMVYPADAISVRGPGCVWSSDTSPVGFVSIDIAPEGWEAAGFDASMAFLPPSAIADLPTRVAAVARAGSPLEAGEIAGTLLVRVANLGVLGAARPPRWSRPEWPAVDRAREYLHAHVEGQPTLDDLAVAADLGKFALLRGFRRRLGTTPHTYLVMLKVDRVRGLLAQGMPLRDAAVAAGFADQSHMGRWFRRICGITPAVYMREVHSSRGRRSDTPGAISFQTPGRAG